MILTVLHPERSLISSRAVPRPHYSNDHGLFRGWWTNSYHLISWSLPAVVDRSGYWAVIQFQLSNQQCEEKGERLVQDFFLVSVYWTVQWFSERSNRQLLNQTQFISTPRPHMCIFGTEETALLVWMTSKHHAITWHGIYSPIKSYIISWN